MKKNNILLALIASLGVGMTAGCGGGTKYSINAKMDFNETGYITGGGKYENGEKVTLRVYPNEGCHGTAQSVAAPYLIFTRSGEPAGTESQKLESGVYVRDGGYYAFEITVNPDASTGTVGTYSAVLECATNKAEDIANAASAKFTISFKVQDSTGKEITKIGDNKPLLDNVEVGYNKKITEINYVDEVEGRITWYEADGITLFDFSKGIKSDMQLIGKLAASDVKSVVADALENFKKTTAMTMTIDGVGTAKLNNYEMYYSAKAEEKKKMEFQFVGTDINDKFLLRDGAYYQFDEEAYYKASLSIDSDHTFSFEDIERFDMFFDHLDLDVSATSTYTFSKDLDGDNKPIKTDITFTKANGDTVTVSCTKYMVKDGSDTVMDIYMNKGKIYKTVDGEGKEVLIEYPENAESVNPTIVKDMYLLRLSSTNTDLNNILETTFNSKFETILKVKQGQSLKEVFNSNNALKDVLRRYNYSVKIGATNVNMNLPYTQSNNTISIISNGNFGDVEEAIEMLTNGGIHIKTETIVFEETDYREYDVAAGTNVFDLASKPSGMNKIIWDALTHIKELSDSYDHFTLSDKTYSFYESSDSGIPYLTITLDDGGNITTFDYFEVGADGKVTTYTSTITALVE